MTFSAYGAGAVGQTWSSSSVLGYQSTKIMNGKFSKLTVEGIRFEIHGDLFVY